MPSAGNPFNLAFILIGPFARQRRICSSQRSLKCSPSLWRGLKQQKQRHRPQVLWLKTCVFRDVRRRAESRSNAHNFPLTRFPVGPDDAMVRARQLLTLLGIGKTTLKRWRREGRIPRPQPIAPGSSRIGCRRFN